jgi:phage terminase small subunit
MELRTTISMALNPKQQRFADEYMVDLNATQAAIRAGYSARSARTQGCRMTTNDNIKNYLQGMLDERAERTKTAADRALEELEVIAHANIENYVRIIDDEKLSSALEGLSPAQMSVIREIKIVGRGDDRRVQLKLYDKQSALRSLTRRGAATMSQGDYDRFVADVVTRLANEKSRRGDSENENNFSSS